jgi:hypothetical protein
MRLIAWLSKKAKGDRVNIFDVRFIFVFFGGVRLSRSTIPRHDLRQRSAAWI